jgi:hypothetical protein
MTALIKCRNESLVIVNKKQFFTTNFFRLSGKILLISFLETQRNGTHAHTLTHQGVMYAFFYLLSGLSDLIHNILEDRSVNAWNHAFFNIILLSAPVCSISSFHFILIQRYCQYRFIRHSFICYYRSYECTVKSVQMVYSDIWHCELLSGSVDL